MDDMNKKLAILMADTYALYLKTQNYHWHVRGIQFKSLHELFEMQYQELADAVDELAERIVILGGKAPASFSTFMKLTRLKEGDSSKVANEMVLELANDHKTLLTDLQNTLKEANTDEGTLTLLGDRMAAHQKAQWMLSASASV